MRFRKPTEIFAISLIFTIGLSSCSDQPKDVITEIQDIDFRKHLLQEFDANGDQTISPDEVNLIEMIHPLSVDNYRGIEYLTYLRKIEANGGDASYIDLKGCSNLAIFNIMNVKKLKRIEFPKNIREIELIRTGMENFEIGDMPYLNSITISESPLNSFKTGICESLTYLNINGSEVDSLDISKYPRLEELYIKGTNITAIDISDLSHLKIFEASDGVNVRVNDKQKIRGINLMSENELYGNSLYKYVK